MPPPRHAQTVTQREAVTQREIVIQRETVTPPQPVAVTRTWRGATRTFTDRVVLRPARIGMLAALAAMVAFVVVRGEGWWIGLGVVLFQAAAFALVAAWMRTEPDRPESPPPVAHQWSSTRTAPDHVPRQRRPRTGE